VFRKWIRKQKFELQLDEELRSYVELQAAEKVRRGMSPDDAFREAMSELGGMEQVKESVRDVRPGVFLETVIRDIAYGARTFRRNPVFSVVALLTLALGIGANTAIFSVVDAVVLSPLPYPQPDRLLTLWENTHAAGGLSTVSPANFYDWREQSHSFAKMAAINPYPDFILNPSSDNPSLQAVRLTGADVSADFFSLLGTHIELGRDFLAEEDRPQRNHVVIITHGTWQQYFGGHADIVGRTLTLNSISYKVVGVLPRDFSFVSKAADYHQRNQFDLFRPMALESSAKLPRGTHPLCVLARLKPGVTRERAQADLDVVAANLERLYPADKGKSILAEPMQQHVVADVRAALLTLLAAVALLLLITCANIGNLLLTRAASRAREIALRAALGASQSRIARQLMTESLVLTAAGDLLGLAFVYAGVPVLVHHLPAELPRTAEIAVNGRVLAFSSLVALVTGLLFGLAPVFHARGSLRGHGRGLTTGSSRLRETLIIGQVATALLLLTGAGLMARSLWQLLQVPPGFRTDHLLTARLSLPPQYTNGYKFGTGLHRQITAYQQRLLDRVRMIPGVTSAAFTAYLPLSGADNSWSVQIEGRQANRPGDYAEVKYRPVGDGYFETIGIPIERGRGFIATDNEDAPLVVAISHSMARRYWGDADPIGGRLMFDENKWRLIVGIVGDIHHQGLDTEPVPEMYLPYSQVPNVEARPSIVLRTSMEPWSIAVPLRKAVAEVDRGVPIDHLAVMQELVSNSAGQPRFRTAVILAFSLLALFVASIGLYGVMSYSVTERTQEFGIRIALGATRTAVMNLVVGQAARLVAIGITIGLAGAALLGPLIAKLLFAIQPTDALTLASVTVLLAIVAFAAVYVPARRAAKSDPMESLRHE
jgi:putative ABC transport system permease protein